MKTSHHNKNFKSFSPCCFLFTVFFFLSTSAFAFDFDGSLKKITITDSGGVNIAPSPVFTYTQDGDTVYFDASGSTDSDGTIFEYRWDFGDGITAVGVTASHVFVGSDKETNLIAHYLFDSDANDASGNENNGAIYGATFVTGKFGNSLLFDGNDYVEVPDSANLNVGENYSISIWLRATNFPSWACLFERGTSPNYRIGVWLTSGKVVFATYNNGGAWWGATAAILEVNQWNHIVAVHDGNTDTEHVYLNGNLIGSKTERTVDTPDVGNLQIGVSAVYPDSNYFNGNIDDVRLYNKILSETEVLTLYSGQATCADFPVTLTVVDDQQGISIIKELVKNCSDLN